MDECVVTFHQYTSDDPKFTEKTDPYRQTSYESEEEVGGFFGGMNDDVRSFKPYQGCMGKKITVFQHGGHRGKTYNTPVVIDEETLGKWFNLTSSSGSSFKIEEQ